MKWFYKKIAMKKIWRITPLRIINIQNLFSQNNLFSNMVVSKLYP